MNRYFVFDFSTRMSFVPDVLGLKVDEDFTLSQSIFEAFQAVGYRIIETNDPTNPQSLINASAVLLEPRVINDPHATAEPWRIWMRAYGDYRTGDTRFVNTGFKIKVSAAANMPKLDERTHVNVDTYELVPPYITRPFGNDSLTPMRGPRIGSVNEYPLLEEDRYVSARLTITTHGFALTMGESFQSQNFSRNAMFVVQRPVDRNGLVPDTKMNPLVLFTNVASKATNPGNTAPGMFEGPTNRWYIQTVRTRDQITTFPTWERVAYDSPMAYIYAPQVSVGNNPAYLNPIPVKWSNPVRDDKQGYMMMFPTGYRIADTITEYYLDLISISKASVFYEGQPVADFLFNQTRDYQASHSNIENGDDPIIVFQLTNSPDFT